MRFIRLLLSCIVIGVYYFIVFSVTAMESFLQVLLVIIGMFLLSFSVYWSVDSTGYTNYIFLKKTGKYISGNKCPKCRSKLYWKDIDDDKEWCRSCNFNK